MLLGVAVWWNVPFQLRSERQTKWKNAMPIASDRILHRNIMYGANIVDSVCWHLIIYKSISEVKTKQMMSLNICFGIVGDVCIVHASVRVVQSKCIAFILMLNGK